MDILKKFKVLYVEDEIEVHNSTLIFLKKFFGEVISAYNGEEGLEKFKKDDFDIVFTDLKMPRLGGHEMLKEIRKIRTDILVVILTASDSHMDVSMSKCDAYLTKPVDFDDFMVAIKKIKAILENK